MNEKTQGATMAVPFSIRMDEELKVKLDREAAAEDRSSSYMAHKAIEHFLDARAYRREVILAAYNAALTEKEFISGDAVDAWVDSWGTDSELPAPKPDIFRS
jgi:predicted transcriptional regulator